MIENERSTAINPGEAVEEKVSLSDRFGLWLGFHRCSQDEYLAMVKGYCSHFGIKLAEEELEAARRPEVDPRGSTHSGRVAWHSSSSSASLMPKCEQYPFTIARLLVLAAAVESEPEAKTIR